MQNAGVIKQACECRFQEIQRQQCDKPRLSLDAGACQSPSKGFQHLNIRGCWMTVAALPDVWKMDPGEHQTLHVLPEGHNSAALLDGK